ncbi:DUF3995 domain-containing protein [Rugosimonospora africana]|uniref:DUF3995 domain-containing protein n=1 Tax=Rugosimonospora africana TaxID=556532 RepID=A0A8J3VR61_9ACTN|nr:DUF3995 domain-containing protein [Rugosimonospora africana]GIH15835.1 hypothetical protein Raf01_40070 [Rugosimonospora africana]
MQTYQLAAIAAAAILGLDALIHAYWLTGRTWPARDVRTLSRAVLNADVPFTPRVLVPLILVLTVGATAVLARAGLLDSWLPGWVPGWVPAVGAIAVAAGATLRAGAGIVWALGVGAERGSAFYRLNLTAYTPVCLLLCAAAATVAGH